MAITRTQIARQLYQFGGGADASKSDFGGNDKNKDRDRRDDRPTMRDIAGDKLPPITNPVFGDPDPNIGSPVDTGTSFLRNLDAERRSKPFLTAASIFNPVFGLPTLFKVAKQTGEMRKALGVQSPTPVDFSGVDRGGDLPYWAQLGFSSEQEYLNALRAQALSTTDQEPEEDEGLRLAFRANGGRIGFRGGDAARSDAASGRNAGRADPGGGVDDRSTRGQTAVNEAAIMMARMQNQNKDRITNPRFTEKFPTTSPVFANFNKMAIDKMIAENLDDDENQTITAGAVDASDFIRNMPEFKQKISDTVSGIMANPDIANLGKTEFAVGGLADGNFDFENARQMYGLGKLVKKVTRTVKKIAKSPVGKAALLYAGGAGLGALGTGTGFAGFKAGLMSPSLMFRNLATSGKGFLTGITGGAIQFPGAAVASNAPGAFKLGEFFGSPLGAITGATALAGLLTPKQEEEAQALADETGIDIEQARNSILARARDDYKMDFRARGFRAEGGIMRAGYQEGSKEPVAKKTMPLLDMDGKEMDLREEGGFVPIGRMEKADDVPARLSKNEFVFTADAVRNAGDGDVDKGAEVMYNMMKNLESGGDVSKESQGLEGARRMFQTSQRLEEVL
jgi:hypothetical protein